MGFGLRMSSKDVSVFLTKVIKEHNFNFYDPEETIFWYCYEHHLPFSTALHLFRQSETYQRSRSDPVPASVCQIQNEAELQAYLAHLRQQDNYIDYAATAYLEFQRLLTEAKQAIADLYSSDSGKTWSVEKISNGDIEHILYSGIPLDNHGNLQNSSFSLLAEHFAHKRFNRQHIDAIIKKKMSVNRFDLITLQFLIDALRHTELLPEERYVQYINETNRILIKCGMMELYPVNPYESFILICLLTDCPLAVYNDVYELSFEEQDASC